MSKSYKSFIKEYSMGLQVPSTSYLKPIGALISGKPLRKKESVKSKKKKKDSGGKLDLDEPTRSHSSLKKAKKVDSKPNDGSDHTQPTTKYKGLAFTVKVPNYVDG